MEQILLAYGIPKETVAAITILYRNTKVKVRSPDGDTEYFDIVAGVLQGDTLAPYLFIICLDYVLRTSIDKIKENGFELTKKRSRRYPATTITDADYADDIAILANTPDQAETLLHSLEQAAASIGLYVNAHKTEYMCYNQTGDISTLDGTPLKLVDKFTYLGSSVESTEKDIETRLTKAWTAINRLSTIWKSDLTDKMKRSFFQAAVTSILLYGCTTWTLTKRLEKKLDGNYTRMLRAILNQSWRQHPTRYQLYGHLPPITKTIQVRRTRHAGHFRRIRDELISDVLLWTPTHGRGKAGRPARTYIQQLCEDTGCCPEDLPRAMNDREEWRERVRDIRAASTIWWWWMVKAIDCRIVVKQVLTPVALLCSLSDKCPQEKYDPPDPPCLSVYLSISPLTCLSLSLSLAVCLYDCISLNLFFSLSHAHRSTHTQAHTHSLSFSLSLSLSLTHTHTNTYIRIVLFSQLIINDIY